MTNSLQVKYANTNHPHPNGPMSHPIPPPADGETTTNFSGEMAVAPMMPVRFTSIVQQIVDDAHDYIPCLWQYGNAHSPTASQYCKSWIVITKGVLMNR